MASGNKKIVLVDAYSQIFRAFYAVRVLSNSKGFPTNALHGFVKILMKLNREYASDYCAVIFDCGRVGFRMELNPEYKANRKPTPDELKMQVPPIREFIEAFGWTILEECEYEADDLIGAIAVNFDGEVKFLSSDKDLSQLINERVTQLLPDTKNAFFERTPDKVVEKFGVSAEFLIDYLALLGDSADNIPGVAGIGPKGAVKILTNYGPLKIILNNPELITDEKVRIVAYDEEGSETWNSNVRVKYKNFDIFVKEDVEHTADVDRLRSRQILIAERIKYLLLRQPVVENLRFHYEDEYDQWTKTVGYKMYKVTFFYKTTT